MKQMKENSPEYKEFLGALKENVESLSSLQKKTKPIGITDPRDIRKMFAQMIDDASKNALLFVIHKSDEIQEAIWALEEQGFVVPHTNNAYDNIIQEFGKETILSTIKKYTEFEDFVASAMNNDPQMLVDWCWIMEEDDCIIPFNMCCEVCGMSVSIIRFAFQRITRMPTNRLIDIYQSYRSVQEIVEPEGVEV
jgi:hypothetical protein